jgi:hypothetical protein
VSSLVHTVVAYSGVLYAFSSLTGCFIAGRIVRKHIATITDEEKSWVLTAAESWSERRNIA